MVINSRPGSTNNPSQLDLVIKKFNEANRCLTRGLGVKTTQGS